MQQRTTNNLGGDGGDRSSVKVTYAPGGKSNFSLGWDNNDPLPTKTTGKGGVGAPTSYGTGANNKYDSYGTGNKYEPAPKSKPDAYKAPFATQDDSPTKTSVKVHYAPGGQSSISFGNEPTDYGRKNTKGSEPEKTSVKVHNPPGGRSNFQLG